jgi:hypothetical protein
MSTRQKCAIVLLIGMAFLPAVVNAIPVFPGAEGWGTETPGGRGGNVYVVTNLNSFGPGSFNEAFRATGPRIIVFRVSGVIDLQPTSSWSISQTESNVTIAGQTSPGGITFTGSSEDPFWSYQSNFHDGVFRFLRIRARSHNAHAANIHQANNFIFDHCDFSGGNDECFSIPSSDHFTVQWCNISNSSAGQTYGSLIGYTPTSQITMHHNLWANHVDRSPHMHWGDQAAPDGGLIDYRNNVCYNFLFYSLSICCVQGDLKFNTVGNYFKAGPQTPPGTNWPKVSGIPSGQHYTNDNIWVPMGGAVSQYDLGGSLSSAHIMPPVTTESAADAYESVLNKVGALPRDPMDTRTMLEVRNQTGQYCKDDDSLITSGPAAPADADMDGLPDFWETAMGFNPNDPSDKNADHDGDGYTNIEEYINDLALARLCEDYYNPVYPIPTDWPDYNPACCKPLAMERSLRKTGPDQYELSATPNPFTGGSVRFQLSFAIGTVKIFNAAGKEVACLQGGKTMTWNGLDKSGRRIGPGVYLVQWKGEGRLFAKQRLLVVH